MTYVPANQLANTTHGVHMQVKMDTSDVTMTLGNKGIILKISNPQGQHIGDLRIGRGHVVWMEGKTSEANGKKLQFAQFLELLRNA